MSSEKMAQKRHLTAQEIRRKPKGFVDGLKVLVYHGLIIKYGVMELYNVSLEGKAVMVTGAAQGIGKCIAVKMAEAGAKGITIVDLQAGGPIEQTKSELEALGSEVIVYTGDVSKSETIKGAIEATTRRWGSLDVLINNAGIARMSDLFTTTEEQWDLVLAVNLRSVFLGMKYGAEVMKEQGGGVIVNTSSIAGVTGGSTGADYGASKAGVIALTKFGAKTLGPYGIRVNAIAPGTIATEMVKNNYSKLDEEGIRKRLSSIPMGRMGEPEEVAKAVLFLASDLASYVSGEVLLITGARMS
ncbi:MAG: SDR family NAD(P)-dependent oxidoreductase [Bacillota bacterium]